MSKMRRRTSSLTGSNQKLSITNNARTGTGIAPKVVKKAPLTKPAWDVSKT
jgi:hypothetical protein